MGLSYPGLAGLAYAQARRAGAWSWPVARKVFAGVALRLVLVLPFTWYTARSAAVAVR